MAQLFRGRSLAAVLEERRKRALKEVTTGLRHPDRAFEEHSISDLIQLGEHYSGARADQGTLTYWAKVHFTGDSGLLEHKVAEGFNAGTPELAVPPSGEIGHYEILMSEEGIDPDENKDRRAAEWLAPKLESLRVFVEAANAQAQTHNAELREALDELSRKLQRAREAAARIQANSDES